MKVTHEPSQYLAEFLGTFFLVFFGCGSIILSEVDPLFNSSSIPFAFGGIVTVMIYAVGHISGGHFNPAVTIAFWATKRFSAVRIPGYLFSQFSGALSASLVHRFIWGSSHSFGSTLMKTSVESGVLVEVILSFTLMFVIISVATDSRAVGELAGIAIGVTVTLCAIVGGPISTASMNPARSFGPALMSGEFSMLGFYLVIPIVGTVLGAKTYEWIRCQKEKNDDHGCC